MDRERYVFFETDLGMNKAVEILNNEFEEYHIVPGSINIDIPNDRFYCVLEHDLSRKYALSNMVLKRY